MTARRHRVIVAIDIVDRARFATIADDLVAAGLTLRNSMEEIGVLTGLADADAIEALRRRPGVRDVRDLGPVTQG